MNNDLVLNYYLNVNWDIIMLARYFVHSNDKKK